MSEENSFLTKNGTVRSVSMIIYSKEYGYLICEEMRSEFLFRKVKFLMSHCIGGKCEEDDICPLWTGIREFFEELDLQIFSTSSREEAIRLLYDEFYTCLLLKYDFLVSKNKRLYNRFYVVNIDTLENEELKHELIEKLLNWKKTQYSSLESVYFWNENKERPKNCTSLLCYFLNNLPPQI